MRKIFLFLLFWGICLASYSQTTVKGSVVDKSTKEPLPGAAVSVKGTNLGTSTDLDGKFVLEVPAGNDMLTATFIGYEAIDVPVQENLTIELDMAAVMLQEFVVVGYGVVRKSDVTGSVAKANVEDLKRVTSVDAAQAMQGRMAGVNVTANSGSPGAGVTVRVRGIGSFGNSDPLYVVDGFPMGDISHIAPTDIESLEVLKDASATAIYGSRGANGVILVKTRTGSKGNKFEVLYTSHHSFAQVAKTLEMANATEFAKAKRELEGGTDAEFALQHPLVQYVLDQPGTVKGTDWQKEIYRTAYSQRHNLSILGSTDNYQYDHGITYSDEQGIVKGTQMQKFMLRSNNSLTLTSHVKAGVNFNYVWYQKPNDRNNDFYGGAIPGALRSDPISTAWDNYTNFYGEVYYSPASENPALSIWKDGQVRKHEHRFMANAFIQIDDLFTPGLSFRAQYGKIMGFNGEKSFSPKYFITATQRNEDQTLYEKREQFDNWVNTNYFSYLKSFNKLNINLTLGTELQASEKSDIWARGYDVPAIADLRYLGAKKDAVKFELGGGAGHNRLQSAFFRSNFGYDDKYLITATMRYDGSSRFTEENRWGAFPSFSAGWNIANEAFMESLQSTLPSLKLRAGWGKVGNEKTAGEFDYVSSVNGGYTYFLGGIPVEGAVQEMLANTELHWENSEQYNVGIDFGLFENRFSGSVDYFIRKTNDMIISRPIPMYAGKKRPTVNAASMENSGFEFVGNYQEKIGDFKFDINLNLTAIRNEVTDLAGGDPIRSGSVGRSGATTRTAVGREIAYFYGYKTDGIFKNESQLAAHSKEGVAIQPSAALGDVKFQDLNGDGKISEEDMTYLGSATPDFTAGLNINLAYKNFDMVLFFYGSYGGELVNGMYQTLYSSNMFETNISRDMAVNHWTPTNPNSDVPRITKADANSNIGFFSDRYVEDGSYIRLRNIQIGYTLPANLSKSLKIKNLRVYASIDNLLTLTKYSGLDPEVFGLYQNPFYYGVDMVTYPQPRVTNFGVNVTF